MFRFIAALKPVFLFMAVLAFLTGIPWNHVSAALIATESCKEIIDAGNIRNHFKTLLARDEVKVVLIQQGINPGEVKLRLDALSDGEILLISQYMDSLQAGGQSGPVPDGGFIVAVGLVLLAAVLILVGIIFLGILAFSKDENKEATTDAATEEDTPAVASISGGILDLYLIGYPTFTGPKMH
jgi:hypothetical protein